jgi:uncharacterized membrane protein
MNWSGQPVQTPAAGQQPTGPTQLAEESSDSQDRLLAAGAYLCWLAGFWIVGPLVIFFLYKDKSRYVAYHALQSVVLSILVSVLAPAIWIAGMIIPMLAAAALGPAAHKEWLGAVFMGGYFLGAIVAIVLPMVWMCLGAWRAYHGQRWRVPIAWRIAKRFVEDRPQQPINRAQPWSTP